MTRRRSPKMQPPQELAAPRRRNCRGDGRNRRSRCTRRNRRNRSRRRRRRKSHLLDTSTSPCMRLKQTELMVLGTAATRAMETAMPKARATARSCSQRSHRHSSASTARTVRTRPRSDHRSTGHIRATCPQSYSPREVRRAVATLAMVTVMLAAGGTLMVLETIAHRAMATVTPREGS